MRLPVGDILGRSGAIRLVPRCAQVKHVAEGGAACFFRPQGEHHLALGRVEQPGRSAGFVAHQQVLR